jgi:hypothetical protein
MSEALLVGVLCVIGAPVAGMMIVDLYFVLRHGHRSMFAGPIPPSPPPIAVWDH